VVQGDVAERPVPSGGRATLRELEVAARRLDAQVPAISDQAYRERFAGRGTSARPHWEEEKAAWRTARVASRPAAGAVETKPSVESPAGEPKAATASSASPVGSKSTVAAIESKPTPAAVSRPAAESKAPGVAGPQTAPAAAATAKPDTRHPVDRLLDNIRGL